jgi:8-oxo-dGTP pyrophosphatase MutT (NUDIX family)
MASSPVVIRQAGVVPVRGGQVCLITSRNGRRWVVPKGCLEPGKTAGEVALVEAWEEAGLVGVLGPEPVGSYAYEKAGLTCHVVVFVMRVTEVADEYPERGQRERAWLPLAQAPERVEDAGLRELIRAVAARRLSL